MDSDPQWYVVIEPASVPGVAEPTASIVADFAHLDDACYWISDTAEIGGWAIKTATISRIADRRD
jgi:hypothetical protein